MDIRTVIERSAITTAFQPIVSLHDGSTDGFEALSRGPAGELHTPRALFAAAARAGMVEGLELACWKAAIRSAGELSACGGREPLLFVNVLPQTLLDPAFLDGVLRALDAGAVPVDRLVIEITEGQRIDDLPFFAARLGPYRERGFRIALDDVGAGHAGLETFVELEPDIIKLDQALIRNADRHPARRAIIEACVLVARRRSLSVVAEGIETAQELRVVRDLGATYGQGYLLGAPAAAREASRGVSQFAVHGLRATDRFSPADGAGFGNGAAQIGDLAAVVPAVDRNTRLHEVLPLFDGELEAVAVLDGQTPCGLIERHHLFETLARPFGRELHLRRAVEEIADSDILLVDAAVDLDRVSRLAMARRPEAVYGHIAVTSAGRFIGVVSVRRLLDAITSLRIEAARSANPLTGLPGSPIIDAMLRSHLCDGRSIGVLHADLDDFKGYNDRHGFHRGDAAIQFTAEVLLEVVSATGGLGSFLGHIGGDDFIAIIPADRVAETVRDIQHSFRERVRSLDVWTGRRMEPGGQPKLDITVASVVVDSEDDWHYARVLDILADSKRAAKALARRSRVRSAEQA